MSANWDDFPYHWICTPCNRHYSLDDGRVYDGKGAEIDPWVNFCPHCGQVLELDNPSGELWGPPQPTLPMSELPGGSNE